MILLTALYNGAEPHHITESSTMSDGPCDGQSGGTSYCPENSYVEINGYYCDGNIGGVASLQSGAVRLDSATSPIPSGAPGAYVGRQGSRDNTGSKTFTAAAGDVFCTTGWAATVDSMVNHRIGVAFTLSGGSHSWQGPYVTPDAATNHWVKVSGCVTAPSGTIMAQLWTQNDGTNGTTANPYWYQTAITLIKQ